MKNTRPGLPAPPIVPRPVSLVYTIYRHGRGLSECEAQERVLASTSRLHPQT